MGMEQTRQRSTVDDTMSKHGNFMSAAQKADYLETLRKPIARPGGSRPLPSQSSNSTARAVNSGASRDSNVSSDKPVNTRSPFIGRPVARPPSRDAPITDSKSSAEKTLRKQPSITYFENGTRWMEKQEARSLSRALTDMDLADEQRLHQAAQNEAAELVWKHQNPDGVYRNPDLRNDYKAHLRKGSYNDCHGTSAVPLVASRSSSGSSQYSTTTNGSVRSRKGVNFSVRSRTTSTKSYGELAELVRQDVVQSKRRTSSGSRRILSGEKKYFMHPDDKIWEDQEENASELPASMVIPELRPSPPPSAAPSHVRKNPFARVRMQHGNPQRSDSAPAVQQSKVEPVEGQLNTANRSTSTDHSPNDKLPQTTPSSRRVDQSQGERTFDGRNGEVGREIRSDEIRAATSKLRRDRSPHLPQPTLVSESTARPIVSFKAQTEPQKRDLEQLSSNRSRVSATTAPDYSIPVINFPDEFEDVVSPRTTTDGMPAIPTIVLPEDTDIADSDNDRSLPTILVDELSIDERCAPASSQQRPLPHASSQRVSAPKSTPHYSPSGRTNGVLCAHCALPIAGRILSAAGERFHPGCFVCKQCNTNLELVAFYPEPEGKREERLARIVARQNGAFNDRHPSHAQESDDGDASLRFYCHLDFHELFSPRCKSCKTPIEGEVVLACGAEWHVGHFFCAQCGDPFESNTPFVEKEGYAWCVGCHTNRYSSKCKKCRKPVTDVVVKALGADWHSECFRCFECNSEFHDGAYFLRDGSQDPVCVRCEEIRLKR